ncbi:hypothetical protein C2S52_013760 [Perilla frutescens var. hirtella]|nr:hypothetical protein C2S51_016037 [Perilla frutescens var. frutescens]KAH6776199.1 hypothetical protein C2S52_013760 [Perilla frutescens var. hirtella]
MAFDSFSLLWALKSCSHSLPLTRHLHAHLLKLGFSAHLYVATCLLSIYASSSSTTVFSDARILFDEMPSRNSVTWNVMITGYSRQGNVKAARFLFDTMPHPSLSSWSAMVAAYIHNSLWNHALALFRQMRLTPDQLTLGPILAGCGRLGSVGLPLGKSIHAFAVKNNWSLNVELGTCLVDMYAKCGLFMNARLIFHMIDINDRNVVAWTAFICGAAQHGHALEALHVFEKMREAGANPNELTFTGILTACAQAGLVDEGRRYFRMLSHYGLRPRIQHYGCMVDLFGKAGLLSDAYELINTMPYQPNAVVWGSFLSSCKLHRQFEMADRVIHEVMSVIKPENDGGIYSIISDLHLLCGRISEAERLRDLMLAQNVRKLRASTFITTGVGVRLV